jgi:transposase
MAARARTVDIPEADRRELHRRARSKGAPARVVEQTRIVLMAGDGVPSKQIAARVGCAEPTVVTWRRRYASAGCPGWKTCHDGTRPRRCQRSYGIGCWSSR